MRRSRTEIEEGFAETLACPWNHVSSQIGYAIRRTEWWKRCLEYWEHRCAYCGHQNGLFLWTRIGIDHFIPLSNRSGPQNAPYNIVPACNQCNKRKNAYDPYEWVVRTFGPRKGKQIIHRIEAYFEYVRSQD